MKRKLTGALLPALVFLVGFTVLLYPSLSDLWNQHRQETMIDTYVETVARMTQEDHSAAWEAAQTYNAGLDVSFHDAFTGAQPGSGDPYWSVLDPEGSGVMGYIEIPKISVRLPIYHGTGEDALQRGIGHLAGTSLPIGGAGSHCVLSGHRGLPAALLFTDLDQLAAGDRFYLHVLGETLAYAVDSVAVVEPTEVSNLLPDAGGDYVTLLTCTPYGVNTHRLLVRGRRVPYVPEETPTITAAEQIVHSFGWRGKAALAAVGVLTAAALIAGLTKKRTKKAE